MKIIIQGKKLDLTPALKVYIESKLGMMEKFVKRWDLEGSTRMRVEVSRTTKHHKKGEVFYAEANLDLPGAVLRAEAYHSDARSAITELKKILEREITKRKEKLQSHRKK